MSTAITYDLKQVIDNTNLTMGATRAEVEAFVKDSVQHGFFSVCVFPNMIPTARKLTAGTATKIAAVVSFPLGGDTPDVKRSEALNCIELGADEIDMVIDVSHARSGNFDAIESEVRSVKQALGPDHILKTIIEVPLLTREQVIGTALAAERGGADIVKTSTGFKGLKLRATTPEDIQLLRSVLKPKTGIKASGGVSTLEKSIAVLDAGATRIGTSSGIAILDAAH
jgi:deoxyribose-phosphate aldolase